MLFTIIMQGKNDNYGADPQGLGGASKRLEITLSKICDNLIKFNKTDIEFIFCDWGSEPDKKIHSFLNKSCQNLKYIYVKPEIAIKYNKQSNYSIVHPHNTSFRRSTGKYVMFVDSDFYMTYNSFAKLYTTIQNLNQNNFEGFYWASRYHIPRKIYNDAKTFEQIDIFLDSTPIQSLRHDKINPEHFMGGAMALLIDRNTGNHSTCWWEELPYWGWQDIELHRRLSLKHKCSGDLEDFDITFLHLDHHENFSPSYCNPHITTSNYAANLEPWGLINEDLYISQ